MANEKRLIDANALWIALDEAGLFDSGNPRHIAQQIVEEQPTVDAVEVRCAKCKHYQQYHNGRTEELCEWGKCKLISMDIDMPCNGFCCFGERKDDGKAV